MKILKKILPILMLAGLVFSSASCLAHTELDKQAIVEAVGIDRTEEGYEVTLQYFSMEGAGGSTILDSTKANVLVVSGKGRDLFTALESASVKCGKTLMYGITNLIVIGKDAAQPDLKSVLSFAESYYQNNPHMLLAVAEEKAADVLNVKFKEENVSANHLRALLINAEKKGLGECKRLHAVLNELVQPTASAVLPLIGVKETGTGATDDGKTVELVGGALFVERKFAGTISLSAFSGVQLLCGKIENTSASTEVEGRSVSVTLYDVCREVEPSYTDGHLTFKVKITAGGKYSASQLDEKGIALSEEVERQCAAFIGERIASAVAEVVNAYGCDPCGIKYAISSRDYGLWLRVAERYGELLKTADFPVECTVNIDHFGLTH
ncbi:MAG: Ger(x)C family spore germination C-terminal domain-containing protein [Bacteroides sp.]|nr:Ger(x)C family spore germination C-terminal domain-containing protein [Eubacterium sp.]MCM1419234.1 Ger(x)C family spore germination C-terminal domain-containing protein [Roseburia sp.]MCM1463092.1 Ger(x)C family spore germination C-terminal domain-containing protein [Bacteroides sp.]